MSDLPIIIIQRLDEERAGREERLQQWMQVKQQLGWLPDDGQIYVERNELILDDYQSSIGNHSYLEQVRLHEVGPGEGQAIVTALLMLPNLLGHIVRDMMTDEERIEIGWADIPREVT